MFFERFLSRCRTVAALFRGEVMVGTACLSARIYDKRGVLLQNCGVIARKKVTSAWVEQMVDALCAGGGEDALFKTYKWHDSGTGVNAENNGDTALQTPTGIARVAGTQIEGATGNIYKSVATITYDGPYAVTEHGLFNVNAAGTLLDRSVFAALNVVNTNTIAFTYEVTFNAEA